MKIEKIEASFIKFNILRNFKTPNTVKPRYIETLYNEVLGITNDFLYPSNSEIYAVKNFDITKPRYGEHILPVPWSFVTPRFHCNI